MRYVHHRGDRFVSVCALVLGVRSELFHPVILVRAHVHTIQEVCARTGYHHVLVGVPDHGHGYPAVPHEQF